MYNITSIGMMKIKVESQRTRISVLQCHRCQHFGHDQARCKQTPRCVKCEETYNISESTRERLKLNVQPVVDRIPQITGVVGPSIRQKEAAREMENHQQRGYPFPYARKALQRLSGKDKKNAQLKRPNKKRLKRTTRL